MLFKVLFNKVGSSHGYSYFNKGTLKIDKIEKISEKNSPIIGFSDTMADLCGKGGGGGDIPVKSLLFIFLTTICL